ncbi:rhamnose-binding lectin-like [Simochromis diagramma]|uniref:rhamnose-binding lectin-like n=1 Tax=Simochromis diagramma TaxID=43689 RepID=UPI001A7E1CBB|nr:rhamnose-binding lectin-like [Simochromis diagramma]
MAFGDGLRKAFVAAAGIAADLRTCSVAATTFKVVGLLIGFASVAMCTVGLPNSVMEKTECDIQSNITYDPGVCKYLETTYDCFTRHSVTCQQSQSNLQCDEGQVIVVSWAYYGRRDKTTCSHGRPDSQLQNVKCFWSESMNYVTTRCNGKNSCTVEEPRPDDPCGGIFKYLEVFYTCQAPSCPAGWTRFGGRCFIFDSSQKNWTDAESSCQTLGGNLASFHSTDEYTFIRELTRTAAGSYETAWVGGNDRETETVWKWSDGSQFDFTNWGSGQPNNYRGDQDCMEINYEGGDFVNDLGCDSRRWFVCVRGP